MKIPKQDFRFIPLYAARGYGHEYVTRSAYKGRGEKRKTQVVWASDKAKVLLRVHRAGQVPPLQRPLFCRGDGLPRPLLQLASFHSKEISRCARWGKPLPLPAHPTSPPDPEPMGRRSARRGRACLQDNGDRSPPTPGRSPRTAQQPRRCLHLRWRQTG
jgi:hypothetical protein